MTIEEIKADKRLRRTYGISLAEYNEKLAAQDGKCAICKRPPVTVRLAVDHDHRFDRIKILVHKVSNPDLPGFKGEYLDFGAQIHSAYGRTRKEVRTFLRLQLRRRSWRGLLCVNCNRGLQKFYDRPERFEAAAQYLRKFLSCA